MAKHRSMIYHILFAVILCWIMSVYAKNEERKAYIVYMGKLPNEVDSLQADHVGMISKVVEKSYAPSALVRSYKRSFNGFAAKLTQTEANKISGLQGVVSVFPDEILQLHTTRSWDFMGLKSTSPRKTTIESDVVIGVIDSGIWPESESFKGEGFGPPPKKWKGACEGGANFTCNNKLIGARHYVESSARDYVGHGTHTASIAAGSLVQNVSFYGIASGIARGGVPSARIAAYKACNPFKCKESNILAAFDDAIADGVDIISVSLGLSSPKRLDKGAVAIGSFHAMEKGVLTTQSTGNSGYNWKATSSTPPWILTVAAGSIDRKIVDKLVLLNGSSTVTGLSVNGFDTAKEYLPIVYGKEIGDSTCTDIDLKTCFCIRKEKVSGKIVLCEDPSATKWVLNFGAAGVILPFKYPDVAYVNPLPAAVLTDKDFNKVLLYQTNTKNPAGKIFKSETVQDLSAPLVASFSSRGPNAHFPNIMKPDVTAPGIDILAAYSPEGFPSGSLIDERKVAYHVLSGSSMACPHVTGIAAYVKTFHPDWSPSAIKSAIMTTARPMKPMDRSNEFGYGSGHVDPVKALSPGLVYEVPKDDYLRLLCTSGINVTIIAGQNFTCHGLPELNDKDMNYPSVVLTIYNGTTLFSFGVNRTVLNVGPSNSTYKATIVAHPKVNITVEPDFLQFDAAQPTKSFTVSVAGSGFQLGDIASSSLVWSDGTHVVRSPIVVYMDAK